MRKLPVGTWILITIFSLSGLLHLINPAAFNWLMWPMDLEPRTFLIVSSGVAELVCAAGLLLRHPWAGRLTALTLLAVWPANIWYAVDVFDTDANPWLIAAAIVRVPLQLPLIWFALKSPKKFGRGKTLKYLQ